MGASVGEPLVHADVSITSNDYETRRRTLSVVEVVGMPQIQREVGRLKMCHGWKRGPEHERASVCLTDLGARGWAPPPTASAMAKGMCRRALTMAADVPGVPLR